MADPLSILNAVLGSGISWPTGTRHHLILHKRGEAQKKKSKKSPINLGETFAESYVSDPDIQLRSSE
jgi:hypothetical protein